MRRVIIESPYAGNIETNLNYAREALRDSLLRGEAPIASHLLYTQEEVLNDTSPLERAFGIAAGLSWYDAADAIVFYIDFGMSKGMQAAEHIAKRRNIPHEYRLIHDHN